MINKHIALAALATIAGLVPAHAGITISTAATQNISCSGGVCAPTASKAVLNVNDLESYLATGNIEVTTTGSGVQAKDIVVRATLSWSSTSTLAFDSYRSITIDKSVSVQGLAGLTLTTNDGGANGDLSFGPKGNVTFANLSSNLTINGAAYALVNTVQGLATAIAANPSGDYALAQSYDAKHDGTYASSPVSTDFLGVLEGLGNTVSDLKMRDTTQSVFGFFSTIGEPGQTVGNVRDLGISAAKVETPGADKGILVGWNYGSIEGCHVSGLIEGGVRTITLGGLAAMNLGTIARSYSRALVSGPIKAKNVSIGGLVGLNEGTVSNSFATGEVTAGDGTGSFGGVVGNNLEGGVLLNSYATGDVSAGNGNAADAISIGGFVGDNSLNGSSVSASYSIGTVAGGSNAYVGGFAGTNGNGGKASNDYWDETTSGTDLGVGDGESSGVTGLTTTELQSGLPTGFDPHVWAEGSSINNGLPYLINNQPPK